MSSYDPGKPGRESNETIGITDGGDEMSLPVLVAGDGVDNRNPDPGTDEWDQIVQAGLDSAAAADPPNSQEIAIWTRVAKERLPLDFVHRRDATLTLHVPSGWQPSLAVAMMDEDFRKNILEQREAENAAIYNSLEAMKPNNFLADAILDALNDATWSVTISSSIAEPIVNGETYVYPRELWGQVVVEAVEMMAERLLPEHDCVVIGQVRDDDAVTQALELLARATGGGASAE